MTSDSPDDPRCAGSEKPFLATRPFTIGAGGWVHDAHRARVVVCSDEPGLGCDLYYSERRVDDDPHFVCPKCGRLSQRMEEVSPEHAGITP